jgi:SAM-dependent methyltransferase
MMERHPLLYELAMMAINFPAGCRIYRVLPEFSGDVLQIGCGTGLLNKYMRKRGDIRFTNLDTNLHALRAGVRWGRYQDFVHAAIDKRTPLQDGSFDVVVFARCFHHVRNHRKAFEECARLLRNGGAVIIADPVILRADDGSPWPTGYMANSSIDGIIWRFTADSFLEHLKQCLPPELSIRSLSCDRPLHVSNYNLFVPQTDMVAVLVKGDHQGAGPDHSADGASQE